MILDDRKLISLYILRMCRCTRRYNYSPRLR